jgi:hypothetical protein
VCRVYLLVAYLDRARGCFATLDGLAKLIGRSARTISYGLSGSGQWLSRDEQGNLRAARPMRGWVSVPYQAFTQLGTGIRCYAAIRHLNRLGEKPSQSRLAQMLGCEKRTIIRHLDALEAAGWITRRRRAGAQGSNVLVALDAPGQEPQPAPGDTRRPPGPGHRQEPVDNSPGASAGSDTSCGATGDTSSGRASDDSSAHNSPGVKSDPGKSCAPAAGGKSSGSGGGRRASREEDLRERAEPHAEGPPGAQRQQGRCWAGSGLPVAVARVWGVLAPVVAEEIPMHGQRRVTDRIVDQLGSRTVGELVERVQRRASRLPLDQQVRDPIALAMWLIAEPGCPDPRCEDGTHLDTGAPCARCAERAAERAAQVHRLETAAAGDPPPAPPKPTPQPAPYRPPAPDRPHGYADDHADELADARAAMAKASALYRQRVHQPPPGGRRSA